MVQLTAVATAGWSFSAWGGDAIGSATPTSITMNGNRTVAVTFTQDEYTLMVNIVGSSTVTKNPSRPTYHYGDMV